jgi:two-component system chemotaxis response regulator CheY
MEKRKVLVVDDTFEHRGLTKMMLMMRGFLVEEATNGAEALKILETPGGHYNLIFSDVSMPNMNGFELLKQVKRRPLLKDIPFILLTSEKKQSDIDTGKRLGCAYYMLKPFTGEDMKKALQAAHME